MTTNKDTRSSSPEIQQQLRVQIVKQRQSGKSNRGIARSLGVSERHASMVWHRYLKDGAESLIVRERGRRYGQHKKIGDRQAKAVQELLLKKPCDVGIHGELWSRFRLQQALNNHLKIQVSIRTLGSYLGQWRMIPEKPLVLQETTNKHVRSWIVGEFRNIERQIEQEHGELHWFTEKMVGIKHRDLFEAFQQLNPMLSTISRQGQVRFSVYSEEITPKLFRDFLCSLIDDVDKKVFLLVKKIVCLYLNSVTESWLKEHSNRIEVIYLPF